MILHLGAHQLAAVWKRNAKIEPYEGTAKCAILLLLT